MRIYSMSSTSPGHGCLREILCKITVSGYRLQRSAVRRVTMQRREVDSLSFTSDALSATDLFFLLIPLYLSLFSYNSILASAATEEPSALV